jgi:flavin-dependent thymidylate synthase
MGRETERLHLMKVTAIDYTGHGHQEPEQHAANVLIFSKATRLKMEPGLFADIASWPWEKKQEELEYMANTIPSSWEFVDYTFLIEGVTRAFTHQLVRTRTASFAQQTMRVLDVGSERGWDYLTGPTIQDGSWLRQAYDHAMDVIGRTYRDLIDHGAAIEDARGILPTNILTNIQVKMNMRTLVDMVRKRSSSRTQGEYRAVLEAIKAEATRVHPWLHLFINRTFDRAVSDLEKLIIACIEEPVARTNAIKLLDQIRSNQ